MSEPDGALGVTAAGLAEAVDRNPLLGWTLERASGERVMLAVLAVVFYGGLAMVCATWLDGSWMRGRPLSELFGIIHLATLGLNAIGLLIVGPSRLAQRLGRERARGTLEALRLTGLAGPSLAVAFVADAQRVPALFGLISAPAIIAGALGPGGPLAVLRAYPALALLGLAYALCGGLLGLRAKKAEGAGGLTVFAVSVLLGVSWTYRGSVARALAILGPWGPSLAWTDSTMSFDLRVLGLEVPGDLLQLPGLALLCLLLLGALSRGLTGAPRVLSRAGGLALAALLIAMLAFTFEGGGDDEPQVLLATLSLVLAAALVSAGPVGVSWVALRRGACRREPDDPVAADERLAPAAFAAGPLLVLCAGLVIAALASAGRGLGILVASCVSASAWLVFAVALQLATLWARDRGAPRALAAFLVVAAWLGPLVASVGLAELGAPRALAEVSRLVCPPYALALALGLSRSPFDPLAFACGCAALNAFAAAGLGRLVLTLAERTVEDARSLVALPADADAPPGALDRRCAAGHLYAGLWERCPHCPPPPASALDVAPTR